MKKALQIFFGTFLSVASVPLIVVTMVWCVSLGSFPYFDTVHSSTFLGFSAMFTVIGFAVAGGIACDTYGY